jgi:putative FmdB family regulatory protein
MEISGFDTTYGVKYTSTPVKGGVDGMPTYEYECGKCGYHFEKFQNMSGKPLKRCMKCRGKLRRLIGSGSGVIFKGSGFYETDYKRKGGGKSETETKSVKKEDKKSGDLKGKSTSTKTE